MKTNNIESDDDNSSVGSGDGDQTDDTKLLSIDECLEKLDLPDIIKLKQELPQNNLQIMNNILVSFFLRKKK